MAVLRLGALPNAALAAAAEFYAQLSAPRVGEDMVIVFTPADHTHRAWRLAAVQELARQHAPARVNGLASNSEPAIAAALAYLAAAPGVTGQLLELDDTGASEVLSSPA
jgi:hypothetical protein